MRTKLEPCAVRLIFVNLPFFLERCWKGCGNYARESLWWTVASETTDDLNASYKARYWRTCHFVKVLCSHFELCVVWALFSTLCGFLKSFRLSCYVSVFLLTGVRDRSEQLDQSSNCQKIGLFHSQRPAFVPGRLRCNTFFYFFFYFIALKE